MTGCHRFSALGGELVNQLGIGVNSDANADAPSSMSKVHRVS